MTRMSQRVPFLRRRGVQMRVAPEPRWQYSVALSSRMREFVMACSRPFATQCILSRRGQTLLCPARASKEGALSDDEEGNATARGSALLVLKPHGETSPGPRRKSVRVTFMCVCIDASVPLRPHVVEGCAGLFR